jgi:hypothetical protein
MTSGWLGLSDDLYTILLYIMNFDCLCTWWDSLLRIRLEMTIRLMKDSKFDSSPNVGWFYSQSSQRLTGKHLRIVSETRVLVYVGIPYTLGFYRLSRDGRCGSHRRSRLCH